MKTIWALLALLLLATPALGEISLQEMRDGYLSVDMDYRIAALTWENTQIRLERERLQKRNEGELVRQEIERSWREGEATYLKAKATAEKAAIRAYFSYQLAPTELRVAEISWAEAQAEWATLEEAAERGEKGLADLVRGEAARARAEQEYARALSTFADQHTRLGQQLGWEGAHKATTPLPEVPGLQVRQEEWVELVLDQDSQWLSLKRSYEQEERDLQAKRARLAPLELVEAQNQVEIARLRWLQAQEGAVGRAMQTWNNFHQALSQLRASQGNLDLAQRAYDIALDQVDAGLISIKELPSREKEMLSARMTVEKDRLNALIQWIEIQEALGEDWRWVW